MVTQHQSTIRAAISRLVLKVAVISALVPISSNATAETEQWSEAANRPWVTREDGIIRKSPPNYASRPWMDNSDGRRKTPLTAYSAFSQLVVSAVECQTSMGVDRKCFDLKSGWISKSASSQDLTALAKLASLYNNLGFTRISDRLTAISAQEPETIANELAKLPHVSANRARQVSQAIARLRGAVDDSLRVASLRPLDKVQNQLTATSDAGR